MTHPLEYFLDLVPDPRRAQGVIHQKVPLLMMIIMANMAGSYGYREMAAYMKNNLAQFKNLFELKHGVMKYVALRTFIMNLDFERLSAAFKSWADQFIEMSPGEAYSFDGKGLNSTVTNSHNAEQNYKSMVSLFSHKTGLVVDVEMIEIKKSHEIGAVQKMISRLEVKGITLIGDALHCQKKTTKVTRETGNHYVLEVKGNQKNLLKQVAQNIDKSKPVDQHITKEKNRGRLENREVYLYDNIEGIHKEWVDVKRILKVIRHGIRSNKPYYEEHFYIASLPKNQAKRFSEIIRGHWGIENGLHYVKDVNMNEDKSRIKGGSAAENLSIIKNMAINIYRHNGLKSIKYATSEYANKIGEQMKLIVNTYILKN